MYRQQHIDGVMREPNLTRKVKPWVYAKISAESSVIRNSAIDCCRLPSLAFSTIDGPDSGPKSAILNDGVVAVVHPKPKGRPEWYHRILAHNIWIIQPIESKCLPCFPIVVVPVQDPSEAINQSVLKKIRFFVPVLGQFPFVSGLRNNSRWVRP